MCITGVKKFADNVVNRVANLSQWGETLFKDAGGRDKVAKAAAAYFSALEEGVKHTNASESTKAGFGFTAKAFSDARMVFSLFNIFTGKIPTLFGNIRTDILIIASFVSGESVEKTNSKTFIAGGQVVFGKSAGSYQNWHEKLLGLVIETFSAIEATAFIAAFGGFRPTLFFSRIFDDSKTAGVASDGFYYLMVVRHISVPISTVANVIHETIVFQRMKHYVTDGMRREDWLDEEGSPLEAGPRAEAIKEALSDITSHYVHVILKSTLCLCEKSVELAKDVIILGKFRVHPAVMVSMNVAIGTFSLTGAIYHAYHSTKFHDAFKD